MFALAKVYGERHNYFFFLIWSSHSDGYEGFYRLGCNTSNIQNLLSSSLLSTSLQIQTDKILIFHLVLHERLGRGSLGTGYREEHLLVPKTQEGTGGWKKSHNATRNFVFCNLRQIFFADQNTSSPHFEDERRTQNIYRKFWSLETTWKFLV